MITETKHWKAIFFTMWTGQAFSLLGSTLAQFAIVWWLTTKTGSATVLATSTMVAALPQIIIGPFAGVLVDHYKRKTIMMLADGIIAVFSLILGVLFLMDLQKVWYIYVILMIRSAGSAFHWPSMQASLPMIVPEQHLVRVVGLNQVLHAIMAIAGPPLGALLLMWLPIAAIMLLDVTTAALAIVTLLFVHIPQPAKAQEPSDAPSSMNFWKNFVSGIKYLANWPSMMVIIIMSAVLAFLFAPTLSLAPLLVTKFFKGEVWQFSLFQTANGIGFLGGSLLISVWGGFKKKIVTVLAGVLGAGAGIFLIGIIPSTLFYVAVACAVLVGMSLPLTEAPLMAILQSNVDKDLHGRVLSIMNSTLLLMSPLSLAIIGPLSDLWGIKFWYIAAGILILAIGIISFFIPCIMQIEEDRAIKSLDSK